MYEVKSGTVCGKAERNAEQETAAEIYGVVSREADGRERYGEGEE
jgi:hypothetical protein